MSPLSIYRTVIEVEESDIDVMGHVNNVCYVKWMQDVAVAHSDTNGWGWRQYEELDAGWVARSHEIEYLASALMGDQIVVETWVADMKKVSSTRSYLFAKQADGEILAKASTRWAFIRLSDAAPQRIPAEITDSFTVVDR